MALVVLRFLEGSVEVEIEGYRARPGLPEWIDGEPGVSFQGQVVHLVAQEDIVSGCVPLDVVPQLAFDSGINECGVPDCVRSSTQERGIDVIP